MLLLRVSRLFCLALATMAANAAQPADASPVRYFSAIRNSVGDILRAGIPRTEYTEGFFASDGFGTPSVDTSGFIAFDYDPETNELLNFHINNGDFVLEGDNFLAGSDAPGGFDFFSNPNGSDVSVFDISQDETRFYFRRAGNALQEVILSFTSALTSAGGRVDFAPFDPDAQFDGEPILDLATLQNSQVLMEATTIFFDDPTPSTDVLGGRVISGPTQDNLAGGGREFFLYGIP